jgi:hypothetical protein
MKHPVAHSSFITHHPHFREPRQVNHNGSQVSSRRSHCSCCLLCCGHSSREHCEHCWWNYRRARRFPLHRQLAEERLPLLRRLIVEREHRSYRWTLRPGPERVVNQGSRWKFGKYSETLLSAPCPISQNMGSHENGKGMLLTTCRTPTPEVLWLAFLLSGFTRTSRSTRSTPTLRSSSCQPQSRRARPLATQPWLRQAQTQRLAPPSP